jgi:hypothetical protein
MISKIKTIHEEYFDERSIGVVLNTIDNNKPETFIFLFKGKRYIFFETIMNMFDYTLYGERNKIKRAYMDEETFDELYDRDNIDKSFNDYLNWQE